MIGVLIVCNLLLYRDTHGEEISSHRDRDFSLPVQIPQGAGT